MQASAKDSAAAKLAQDHYEVEPALVKVIRIVAPEPVELRVDEPIKLLEVNTSATALGIRPVFFGGDTETPFPSVVVDVTPQEYEEIVSGRLGLPNQWRLGVEYPCSATGVRG